MPRGGHRDNAGRKTSWINAETQVIRVPKVFVPQLMQMAKSLDRGEVLDLVTKSKTKQEDENAVRDVDTSLDQLSLLGYSDQITDGPCIALPVASVPGPLSCRALARRLGWGRTTVANRSVKETFTEQTRGNDPEGTGWVFNAKDKLYYPVL